MHTDTERKVPLREAHSSLKRQRAEGLQQSSAVCRPSCTDFSIGATITANHTAQYLLYKPSRLPARPFTLPAGFAQCQLQVTPPLWACWPRPSRPAPYGCPCARWTWSCHLRWQGRSGTEWSSRRRSACASRASALASVLKHAQILSYTVICAGL